VRNTIKKILQESDLDWIKEPKNPLHGLKLIYGSHTKPMVVIDSGDREVIVRTPSNGDFKYNRRTVQNFIKNGTWRIVESTDLDWIKDTEGVNPLKPQVGYVYDMKGYADSFVHSNGGTIPRQYPSNDIIEILEVNEELNYVMFDTIPPTWGDDADEIDYETFIRDIKEGETIFLYKKSTINESNDFEWVKSEPVQLKLTVKIPEGTEIGKLGLLADKLKRMVYKVSGNRLHWPTTDDLEFIWEEENERGERGFYLNIEEREKDYIHLTWHPLDEEKWNEDVIINIDEFLQSNINESDDLEWIQGIEDRDPKKEFRVGDVIDVTGIRVTASQMMLRVIDVTKEDVFYEVIVSDSTIEPVGETGVVSIGEGQGLYEDGYWTYMYNDKDSPFLTPGINESNDFDWIKNDPTPLDGVRFSIGSQKTIYTIVDVGGDKVYITWDDFVPGDLNLPGVTYHREDVVHYLENNDWEQLWDFGDDINESSDFEWIKDIPDPLIVKRNEPIKIVLCGSDKGLGDILPKIKELYSDYIHYINAIVNQAHSNMSQPNTIIYLEGPNNKYDFIEWDDCSSIDNFIDYNYILEFDDFMRVQWEDTIF
jgi:hypothetical protein